MISRIENGTEGYSNYLKNGLKKDNQYTRDEKDKVLSLYGNLDDFERAEKYTNQYKKEEWGEAHYKRAFISFSDEDMKRLEKLSDEEFEKTLKDVVVDYLKFHTSGYDLDNEIIAYAEAHIPKIKADFNSRGKYEKRYLHLHIGISLLNALNDTKIRTAFYNNSFLSDVLDKYIAKKYNLTFARKKQEREKGFDEIKNLRKYFKEKVENFNDSKDLENYLNANGFKYCKDDEDYKNETGLKYKYIETHFKNGEKKGQINNRYIVAYNPEFAGKRHEFRFTGKGFENVAEWQQGEYKTKLEDMTLEDLEKILLSYYAERSQLIDDRRSVETKQMLSDLYKDTSVNQKYKIDIDFINKAIQARETEAENETSKKEILKDLENGKSIFLTGGAGTGKSYMTRQIISDYEKKHKTVAKLGSTGIAAQNIQGETLHTFFNTGIIQNLEELKQADKNKNLDYTLYKIRNTDLIVIDEVSMMSDSQMEMIQYRLEQADYKGKILLVGDFQQLPPVQGDYSFTSQAWKNLNIVNHKLNVIKRSDDKDFSELLNRARYGKISDEDDKFLKSCETKEIDEMIYTHIFSTNRKVKAHNDKMTRKMAGSKKLSVYKTDIKSNKKLTEKQKEELLADTPYENELKIVKNVPVLITINDKEQGLANGQRGIFKGTNLKGEAVIELNEDGKKRKVTLKKQTFTNSAKIDGKDINYTITQYPIKISFATTVHKSQGMSIENLAIDPNDHFTNNQFYVAISRSSNPSKMKLLKRNEDIHHYQQVMMTDEKVLKFYHPNLENETIKANNVITTTYQQKLFYKQYGHMIDDKLSGYFVTTDKSNNKAVFENKKKDIKIVDNGDKITSEKKSVSLKEEVRLMLDIAEAKEWKLDELELTGSDEFKAEVHRQANERIKEKQSQEFIKQLTDTKLQIREKVKVRATSPAQEKLKEVVNEELQKRTTKDLTLILIKQDLKAEEVLKYAIEKYRLNRTKYEVVADNKINNLKNRQKPKNIIDFLQKEVNLSTAEAIDICKNLYKDKTLRVNSSNQKSQTKQQGAENAKQRTSERRSYKDTTVAERGLYKSNFRDNEQERTTKTRNDMSILSKSDMVQNTKSTEMLLSVNGQSKLDRERAERANYSVRRASYSDTTVRTRELEMPIKKLNISYSTDKNKNAYKGWNTKEVTSYTELAKIVTSQPYSHAKFGDNLTEKGSQRHNKNIESYNNLLIYDIDNDPKDTKLSLKQAQEMLKKHNISAMIIPSKSHQKRKITDSGIDKGIQDRYRIIIPTATSLQSNNIAVYKEFKELTLKHFNIENSVDKTISTNPSTLYYPSPATAKPIIIKSKNVMQIDKIEAQAIQNVKVREQAKQVEQARIKKIKSDIEQYRKVEKEPVSSDMLTYCDIDKINSIDIKSLIYKHEKEAEEYKEGGYEMIKTSLHKYSLLDDNLAYDFKFNKTQNSLTYLKSVTGIQNLNVLARKLEKETGEKYLRINVDGIKTAVAGAKTISINDKNFEEEIKNFFKVKYCKLDMKKETLKIADIELKFNEIDISKEQLIKQFEKNRELLKSQQKTHQSQKQR